MEDWIIEVRELSDGPHLIFTHKKAPLFFADVKDDGIDREMVRRKFEGRPSPLEEILAQGGDVSELVKYNW